MDQRDANDAESNNCLVPQWCKEDPCFNCLKGWRVIVCGAWAAGRADHTQVIQMQPRPQPDGARPVHPHYQGRRRYPPPPADAREATSREPRPRMLGVIPLPHPHREPSPPVTQVRGKRTPIDPHANHVHSDKTPAVFTRPVYFGQVSAGEASSAQDPPIQSLPEQSDSKSQPADEAFPLQTAPAVQAPKQDLAPGEEILGQPFSDDIVSSQVLYSKTTAQETTTKAGSRQRKQSFKRGDDIMYTAIPDDIPRRS